MNARPTSSPMRSARALGAAGMIALCMAGGVIGGAAAPAEAATGDACDPGLLVDSEVYPDARVRTNPAFERMNVPAAHEIADGTGVTVAVVDSGINADVLDDAQVTRAAYNGGSQALLLSGHGTIVAGLIAGKDGVAPKARLYDVRAYDRDAADQTDGEVGVSSRGMAAALNHIAQVAGRERIGVVNISLAVRAPDQQLADAVAALVAADVVVVASAGNVATGDAPAATEDARDPLVLPADLPGVLAVSAVGERMEDLRSSVLPNADTDVAAPTRGAVSANLTDQRCVIQDVATSWAAAEVSGVAALLRQRFPDDSAAQIVARIEGTAEANAAGANPWTGSGVVQAHDALTRTRVIDAAGNVGRTTPAEGRHAGAPEAPGVVDEYARSRTLVLWSALLAGVTLGVAFVLRPLLRR